MGGVLDNTGIEDACARGGCYVGLFGVGGPPERSRYTAVELLDEAVDRYLALGYGFEDRLLQAPPCQLREELFDSILPGERGGREVRRPPGIPGKPGANLFGHVRRE